MLAGLPRVRLIESSQRGAPVTQPSVFLCKIHDCSQRCSKRLIPKNYFRVTVVNYTVQYTEYVNGSRFPPRAGAAQARAFPLRRAVRGRAPLMRLDGLGLAFTRAVFSARPRAEATLDQNPIAYADGDRLGRNPAFRSRRCTTACRPSCDVHGRDPQMSAHVCAVTRRRFPVGASPTRQPLQPEATGAVMEETKWLKPITGIARCCARGEWPCRRRATEKRDELASLHGRLLKGATTPYRSL